MHISAYLADQNPHRDRSLGITRFTHTLLDGLVALGVDVTTLVSASSTRFGGAVRERSLPVPTDRALLRVACDQLAGLWPSFTAADGQREQARLFPKGFLPWAHPPRSPRTPVLVPIIHDAILHHYAEHHPRYMPAANLRYFLMGLQRTLEQADTVVTISEHARGQLARFADARGIRLPSVTVVPSASAWQTHLEDAPLHIDKGDYVVHLASPAPHKRTLALLRMWKLLQRRGERLPALLLIGQLPEGATAVAQRLRNVTQRAPLADADLAKTIQHARALLMPSEIEGFGLPVLEAFYLQTPACYGEGTAMDAYMRPVSTAGAYQLGDADSLLAALQRALAMSPSEVWSAAQALCQRHSTRQLATGVRDVIASTGSLGGR